jgi:hypothetical protein
MAEFVVNGLPLPELLVELLQQNRWQHPGDDVIRQLIPYLREPVDFLQSVEKMCFESPGFLADDPIISTKFHLVRGSEKSIPIDLPWLDVERMVFLAVNRIPGDDVGIALDYRADWSDPRVVASNIWNVPKGVYCIWQEVTPTFSHFAMLLGL